MRRCFTYNLPLKGSNLTDGYMVPFKLTNNLYAL